MLRAAFKTSEEMECPRRNAQSKGSQGESALSPELATATCGSLRGILVFFHCRSNAGYAIRTLEEVLLNVAQNLTASGRVYFGYRELDDSRRHSCHLNTMTAFSDLTPRAFTGLTPDGVEEYLANRGITLAIGFDQPVALPGHRVLRRAGVRTFVSYWGAPMSGINHGLTLVAKRIHVLLTPARPDHFIFESEAMRETAVRGRGIARRHTSVCHLGVDVNRFRPAAVGDDYAHRAFGIPRQRKIVYYSGHFEPRKGVAVILRAVRELVEVRGRRDVHFLLLGNRGQDAERSCPSFQGQCRQITLPSEVTGDHRPYRPKLLCGDDCFNRVGFVHDVCPGNGCVGTPSRGFTAPGTGRGSRRRGDGLSIPAWNACYVSRSTRDFAGR